MKRYGYYEIKMPLEDAWNRTIEFFEGHKSKIVEKHISPNNLYRMLRMKHVFSMHLYGTSMGETYELAFGNDPADNTTYVSISVKYSNFGRGIPSKVPKDMMKKWAYGMGITPVKLVKEIDYIFLAHLDKIQTIPLHQVEHLSRLFCAMCGEANKEKDTFCVSCGTRLDT